MDRDPEARRRICRLEAIIERDRTMVARGIVAVRKAIKDHEWLCLGRGSYEYDDERWKDEFGAALAAIEEAMEPLSLVAANLTNSPRTPEEIVAARQIPMRFPQ